MQVKFYGSYSAHLIGTEPVLYKFLNFDSM